MKKIFYLLAGVCFLFIANTASATIYEETVDLDRWLAEGPISRFIAKQIGYTPSTQMLYSHSTPSQFEVPYDMVNSATLTISAYYVDGTFIPDCSTWCPFDGETVGDDQVVVMGEIVGTLDLGGSFGYWKWFSYIEDDDPSITEIDITSVFDNWANGTDLDVAINAAGCLGDAVLYLGKSVFTLDYEDGTAPTPEPGPSPVPEPAAMMLFGIGLLGLAGASRRKK